MSATVTTRTEAWSITNIKITVPQYEQSSGAQHIKKGQVPYLGEEIRSSAAAFRIMVDES
jgi:hypothetical protein